VGYEASAAKSSAGYGCKKFNAGRVNNKLEVMIPTSFCLPQPYNTNAMRRWVSSMNRRGMTMRNALYQIALLIAAVGLSGTLFSATLA